MKKSSTFVPLLGCGVMVTQQILVLLFMVRVRATQLKRLSEGQPFFVYRLPQALPVLCVLVVVLSDHSSPRLGKVAQSAGGGLPDVWKNVVKRLTFAPYQSVYGRRLAVDASSAWALACGGGVG